MAISRLSLIFILFIALFFILSRFYDLGHKPYHHDESLYAVTSWRYATHGSYKFDPMLHGPFLFHLQAGLFEILPVNDFTGRLPTAISGLLIVPLAWPLFQKLNISSTIMYLAIVSLSPTLCYFSRFLGMDTVMLALVVGFLSLSYLFYKKRAFQWLYLASLFFSLMVCTKLNFLFYGFSFLSFFIFQDAVSSQGFLLAFKSRLQRIADYCFKNLKHVCGVIFVFIFVFCLFYSSIGRNPEGILDVLYRKMIPYWVHQNQIQRIAGPFHYYFPLIAIYEIPIFLGLTTSIFATLASSNISKKRFLFYLIGASTVLVVSYSAWTWLYPTFSKLFHMNRPWHPALLILELGVWYFMVRAHLAKKEFLQAFSFHWGASSLVLYSYAGEKVPWLSIHLILPWCFYLSSVLPTFFGHCFVKPFSRFVLGCVLVVLMVWQGFLTFRSSFTFSSDPRERLVYTHTSWEIIDLVNHVESLSETTEEGTKLSIQVIGTGHSVWPLAWYLRNYKQWYWPSLDPEKNPAIVIDNWENRSHTQEKLISSYKIERYKLREWWVPDMSKATMKEGIRYYLTRKVFSTLGSQDIAVFIREDLLPKWNLVNGRRQQNIHGLI